VKTTCYSIDDFLTNLKAHRVYNRMVYFERHVLPLNGTNGQNATSFELSLQLSAVITHREKGQSLLDCREYLGVDRYTLDGGREGSEAFEEAMKTVMKFCTEQKLTLLPGVLDV